MQRLAQFSGSVLFGPRSGSKTECLHIPDALAPGPLQRLIPLRVTRVESLRPGASIGVNYRNQAYQLVRWREYIETELTAEAHSEDGWGVLFQQNNYHYLGGWPEATLLHEILHRFCHEADIATQTLPTGLRLRRRGDMVFAFNYGPAEVSVPAPEQATLLLGQRRLALPSLQLG